MNGKTRAWLLVGSLPLFLLALAWQGGRFAALEAEARRLEASQRAWIEANRKLAGSIAVLESRERAAFLARRLGLEPVSPDRRLIVVLPGAGGTPAAGAGDGGNGG